MLEITCALFYKPGIEEEAALIANIIRSQVNVLQCVLFLFDSQQQSSQTLISDKIIRKLKSGNFSLAVCPDVLANALNALV